MNFNTIPNSIPSLEPIISRDLLLETEEFDEIPCRVINFIRSLKASPKESIQTFQRLIYKNRNQLHSSTTFRKIVYVSRLLKKLNLFSFNDWLASLLKILLSGKPVETTRWRNLPSNLFLMHGLHLSISRYRLIKAFQLALLDAFRFAQQDISKFLFVPVNLSFIATMSRMYEEFQTDLNDIYKGLYKFQRGLLAMLGENLNEYSKELVTAFDFIEESSQECVDLSVEEETPDLNGIHSVQTEFWGGESKAKKNIGNFSSDNVSGDEIIFEPKKKKRNIKVKSKKKESSSNEIDNIFDTLF